MYLSSMLLCLCLAVPGFGKPPAPINVTMDSRNLRNVLRWSRPPGLTQEDDVMYTVEFKLNVPKQNYNIVCVTLDLYCDLTLVSHDSSVRVRAAVRDSESDWETISFSPPEHSYGKLLPPAGLAVDSVNLRNILRWKRPPGLAEDVNVNYRVQYKPHYNHSDYGNLVFHTRETRELHYELTSTNYRFYARVRAEVGASESEWVDIIFDPYEETVISPPELLVASIKGKLELSFSGPKMANGDSIKETYGELDYHVVFWEQSDPSNVMSLSTSFSTAVLRDLEKRSTYCMKVQAYIADYNKSGEFSPVICEETTDDGKVPAWKIALLFLGAMFFVMLVILVSFFVIRQAYKQYKSFPSYSLPQHLKEYLSAPFYSPPPLQTQPCRECGDCNDQLIFVSVEGEEQENKDSE